MSHAQQSGALSKDLPGQHLPWLEAIREDAGTRFSSFGFPAPTEEEWRYTPLTGLAKKSFSGIFQLPALSAGHEALIEQERLDHCWSIVLVDGHYVAGLSRLEGLPEGVEFQSVSESLQSNSDRIEGLLQKIAADTRHRFVDFTSAFFRDGVFIAIPAGTVLQQPIQILHLSTRPEGLAVLRHLVSLGHHAEAQIIETYAGENGADYLTAVVTEISLAEGARLDHSKLQNESTQSYHFGGIYIHQHPASRLVQNHAGFGAALARTEIHSRLEKGSECELNGLCLSAGRQHTDTHTILDHQGPEGRSREQYRYIAAGRSRGVFSGRIVVNPLAQKTDAGMNCRNLLLSDDAEIDGKPQLEIHADDVKCSHGVTVGQLDMESVFYLQSRGIDEVSARNMLTFAFANEMVDKVENTELKALLLKELLARFPAMSL